MPVLNKEYNISKDPEQHGIGGASSGAIAAFTVAWERPNDFRKVLSIVGSFVEPARRPRLSRACAQEREEADSRFSCDGRNDNRAWDAAAPTTRRATGSSRMSG